MAAEPSIWKKEIKLRRARSAAVAAVATELEQPEQAAPPVSLAPQVAIEPRFRRIEVLGRLIEEYADEFPDRLDERRTMLARLAESAVDGLVPPELDSVIHTLFYDLLHREPEPPKGFWKREHSLRRPRKAPANKLAAVAPAREPQPEQVRSAATTTPFWRKELSLGRSPQPEVAVAEPVQVDTPKTSFLKREISLGRSSKAKTEATVAPPADVDTPATRTSFLKKEISLGRKARPKVERVDEERPKRGRSKLARPKLERKPKLPKESEAVASDGAVKTSALRRELRLPKPKLTLPRRNTNDMTKIVGLRIGSSQLAAALVRNNGSAEVLQLVRSPLDRGIVAVGEVRDPDALADNLKRFFSEHRLPRRGVRLGIATNRIGVRVLEVPVMEDPKQLANAIRFRAQEVLPIPISEAVLDHIVIGTTEDAEGPEHRVLLVFAHRELVDGYVDACNRAGLKLLGIDFDAFALLRALSAEVEETGAPRAALIAVSIGHERTIFAVSDGKVCDFARVLEWGGSSLDLAIARALEIEPAEAELIKQQLPLAEDGEVEGLTPLQLAAARAAVKQDLQLLARELVSSLQFYQSRPGSLDIGEILLTGGGAQLAGIETELTGQLGVPVRVGDPLQRVKLGKDVAHPASPSLTIAVGLGVEESG